MVVKGKTIGLRTVREADLDWLFERINDIEMRGLYFPISIQSETAFRERFREDGFWSEDNGTLLITDIDDKRIFGQIMRFRATPYWDNYEIGYRLLDMSQSGRGIMTEALMLLTYSLFTSSPVHRLELKIMPANIPSRRVAEKCGYQLEGTAREVMFNRGVHEDMLVYSHLRHEGPQTLTEALERIGLT